MVMRKSKYSFGCYVVYSLMEDRYLNDYIDKCKIIEIRILKDRSKILLQYVIKEFDLDCGVKKYFYEDIKFELRYE